MPQISLKNPELTVKDNKVVLFEGLRIREFGHRRGEFSHENLSGSQIYEIKKQQRLKRARALANSEKLKNYIDWIVGIQLKLGLSTPKFAVKLGVSAQTVYLWKRKTGHFPSKRTLIRLLELELEGKIPVKVIRISYGVRI